MEPTQPTTSDTNSAPPATLEPRYDLVLPVDDPVSSSAKCTTCEAVTVQLSWKIMPQGLDEPMDPMEQLKKAKRIIFCMSCANMRLTN